MAQMWYIDASSLPFEKRSELYDKLSVTAWECCASDVELKELKAQIENESQAKSAEAVVSDFQATITSCEGSL